MNPEEIDQRSARFGSTPITLDELEALRASIRVEVESTEEEALLSHNEASKALALGRLSFDGKNALVGAQLDQSIGTDATTSAMIVDAALTAAIEESPDFPIK